METEGSGANHTPFETGCTFMVDRGFPWDSALINTFLFLCMDKVWSKQL